MKPKKILKIVMAVVVAFLLFIILTVLFWLGPTVKLVAEHVGLKALGTPLTINRLSINPRKGTIHLSDFSIANPDTCVRSNAVSLASLDISIDMGSLFSKTVVVHEVRINSPKFIYEQSSATDNITEFIHNIQEFVDYDPSAPPEDPRKLAKKKQKQEERALRKKGSSPRTVIIESLLIKDTQFHLANTDDALLDFGIGFEQLYVSMTNGTVQLDNFYVSNPGRLETPDLLMLEQIEISLEPGSIYSSNVTIHAVNIKKPHAVVEYNPETDTLGEFLKIASSLVAKIPTNAPGAKSPSTTNETKPPAPEVTLETLTIDDAQFHVVNIDDPELSVYLGLEQLTVAMQEGRVNLNNLFLTNPKRLNTPNLFSLAGISVDFKPESLKSDTLVLNDIQVKQPYAFLEVNKVANTTDEFMKIANGFLKRVSGYPTPALPAAPKNDTSALIASTDAPPPIELQNLLVDDIQIKLLNTTSTNDIPTEPRMLAGIGEFSIKLIESNLQIKSISVPNAPGFHAANLFHLENIDVTIQPASLFSDQIVIDQVFINSPEVNLEQTEKSGNVAALQLQLMQLVPPPIKRVEVKTDEITKPEEVEALSLAEPPVLLHQLTVTNFAVNLKMPINTNQTDEARFAMDLNSLNPMNKLSLEKLNPLAKESEEKDPSAPVTLVAFDTLSLEPLKGLFRITHLRVSNPPEFSKQDLVMMDEFRIALDPDTLQADTLLIKDILISKPRVRYERQIMSDNIKAMQKEIEQACVQRDESMKGQETESATEVAAEPSTGQPEKEAQKVIIERVLIDGCIVYAKLSALPAIPIPLPFPELKNIGKEKGGATAAEVSKKIYDTFYEEMINVVGNTTGIAGDALKGAGSLMGNMTGGLTDGIGNIAGGLKPGMKKDDNPPKKKKTQRKVGGRSRRF